VEGRALGERKEKREREGLSPNLNGGLFFFIILNPHNMGELNILQKAF